MLPLKVYIVKMRMRNRPSLRRSRLHLRRYQVTSWTYDHEGVLEPEVITHRPTAVVNRSLLAWVTDWVLLFGRNLLLLCVPRVCLL